jgi:hypothetical protein
VQGADCSAPCCAAASSSDREEGCRSAGTTTGTHMGITSSALEWQERIDLCRRVCHRLRSLSTRNRSRQGASEASLCVSQRETGGIRPRSISLGRQRCAGGPGSQAPGLARDAPSLEHLRSRVFPGLDQADALFRKGRDISRSRRFPVVSASGPQSHTLESSQAMCGTRRRNPVRHACLEPRQPPDGFPIRASASAPRPAASDRPDPCSPSGFSFSRVPRMSRGGLIGKRLRLPG